MMEIPNANDQRPKKIQRIDTRSSDASTPDYYLAVGTPAFVI
jgi:hypothetical protein